MEIYIVRHGQTIWNMDKRLQGSTDIELTEKGIEVAVETGETLKDTRIDVIYSSPLKRAYHTAEAIRGTKAISIITDDRLRELSFGDYEGHTTEELNNTPGCTFKYFFDKPEKYMPGPNGETLLHLCERAKSFMTEVIEPLSANNSIERVMIVAHGALNKALMTHVKNLSIPDFWSGGLQRNCNVIILDYSDGKYKVIDETKIFYVPDSQKILDTAAGLQLTDNDDEIYNIILQAFIDNKDSMQKTLLDFFNNGEIDNFAIKAHGLKGNAKTIGAIKLADLSLKHELAGKSKDVDYIKNNINELIAAWDEVIDAAKKYLK